MKLFETIRPISKRSKVLLGTTLAVLIALVVALPSGTQAALGADRQTKAWSQGTAGFDHVQFNSFTGIPDIGDERDYFTGMIDGAAGNFSDPMTNVKAGDTLLLRIYVDNNADDSLNASGKGIATNTRVRVALPTGLAQSQTASAFISADNAQPQTIEDTLGITTNTPVRLEYVPGSARVKSRTGSLNVPVSDSIVTSGVTIGSEALDGKFRASFDHRVSVGLKVKLVAPSYTLQKNVRLAGTQTFTDSVSAKPGDKVEFNLGFQNTGTTNLSNVVIGDRLPVGLTYVPGSTQWISGHTNGQWAKVTTDNWMSGGLNVGPYGPNGTVLVRYTAQVAAADELECGTSQLVNHGFAKPQGEVTITDPSTVRVTRNCTTQPQPTQPQQPQPQQPAASFTCDLLDMTKTENRTVTVTSLKTTATNGATFKNVVVDWGDGTEMMTDTIVGKTHQYSKDGTYTVKAVAHFDVNGANQTATSVSCTRIVEFTTPVQPAASSTPVAPASDQLPNVGAGNVLALFAAATAIGAIMHRLFLSRRMAR